MRRLISIITFLFLTTIAFAIPAKRTTFVATQSDGTKLTLMLMGDEHMHYYLNVKTNEKMLRGDNGDYYVMSETVYKERKSQGDARRSEVNATRIKRLNARRTITTSADGRKKVGSINGGITGQKKGLVILVNFKDVKFNSQHTQTTFDNMFNEEGYNENGHIGSVHDYFKDQSYGTFDLSFDVVGPVTLSNNMSYYGGNDKNGEDLRPAEMVIDACKLAYNAGVDFSKYDWDGDGEVEQVFVIYAGYGEASGGANNTIWPHEWNLSSAKYYGDGTGALKFDGRTIDTYACSCELAGDSGNTLSGIGTACHEFSHCLGYPDFYDTDYSGGRGMSSWDIMDAGSYNGPQRNGEVPAGYSAYERYEAGWLEDADLFVEPSTISNMPPINENPIAYMFCNGDDMDDYCFIENRKSDKWFRYYDNKIAGEGLFVTQIKYDKSAWDNNKVNDDPNNQCMTWIAPDNDYDSATGAFFPSKNTNSINIINHALSDITKNDDGTVSFLFDGGEIVDDGNRYTITYVAGVGGTCPVTSWTQTDFQEQPTLPKAYPNDETWTFVGWSTEKVEEVSTFPSTLIYYANSVIALEGDLTLYAVYKKTSTTGEASNYYQYDTNYQKDRDYLLVTSNKVGEAYVLDAANLSPTAKQTAKATPITIIEKDGKPVIESVVSTAVWTGSGTTSTLQLKNGTNYLKINGNGASLTTSSSDLYWGNSGLHGKSNKGNTSYYVQLDGTDFVFNRTKGSNTNRVYMFKNMSSSTATTTIYSTDAGGSEDIATPTISFASPTQNLKLGDSEIFTATVTGSTGEVTYSSSNEEVATVGPKTGRVATHSTGTTKITATVAAVEGVSKSASASYTLTVEMPKLQSIAVTTPPTTTTYWEGETFDKTGMVVTATYENGYKDAVDIYTVEPTGALTKDDTSVTITYTEGDVTVTTTYPITVNVRPLYTITFDAGSGTCATASLTEPAFGEGITLPTATGINEEWVFAGWATENVSSTNTRPTLFNAGTTYTPTANQTLYAVYALSESTGGSGNYELVTEALDDWSGDYLIAYSSTIFANGQSGGKTGIGKAQGHVNPGTGISKDGNTVNAEFGDLNHITFETIEGGYALKTQDGLYNINNTDKNGIVAVESLENISPITISFITSKNINIAYGSYTFKYNSTEGETGEMFRFYKGTNEIFKPVYLYKKQGTLLNVTYATSPTGSTLVTPTIAFANPSDKEMLVGDTYENIATSDSEGTITYSSSDVKVVTVDKVTGEVTAIGVGNATITAFVDAVAGVSKSASTTYGISVTMPELSSIEIKSEPTKTTYNEGEVLSNEGLVITATYVNGYVRDITQGYTTSPAEGEPVALDTKEVTINYTEGDITKTATYSITVNELPKYAVTFMINGKPTVISQSIANTAIETPAVADVITTIDGEEATYTFAGWVNADVAEETTTKPKYITLTDGKYTPTEATTLYAVYVRTNGNVAKGFHLSMTTESGTTFVGAVNSGSQRFDTTIEEANATTLFYTEGSLWYLKGTTIYYVDVKSGKAELTFSTTKNTNWEFIKNENGTVSLSHPTDYRYLGLNGTYFRAYLSAYEHEFNITYTGETFSLGSTSFYTSHPISAEEPTAPTIKTLAELIEDMLNNKATKADVDKMADELLGK